MWCVTVCVCEWDLHSCRETTGVSPGQGRRAQGRMDGSSQNAWSPPRPTPWSLQKYPHTLTGLSRWAGRGFTAGGVPGHREAAGGGAGHPHGEPLGVCPVGLGAERAAGVGGGVGRFCSDHK